MGIFDLISDSTDDSNDSIDELLNSLLGESSEESSEDSDIKKAVLSTQIEHCSCPYHTEVINRQVNAVKSAFKVFGITGLDDSRLTLVDNWVAILAEDMADAETFKDIYTCYTAKLNFSAKFKDEVLEFGLNDADVMPYQRLQTMYDRINLFRKAAVMVAVAFLYKKNKEKSSVFKVKKITKADSLFVAGLALSEENEEVFSEMVVISDPEAYPEETKRVEFNRKVVDGTNGNIAEETMKLAAQMTVNNVNDPNSAVSKALASLAATFGVSEEEFNRLKKESLKEFKKQRGLDDKSKK